MDRVTIDDLRRAAETTNLSLNTIRPLLLIAGEALGITDFDDRANLAKATAYLYSKYGVWYVTYFSYGYRGIYGNIINVADHQGYQDGKSCRPLLHDLVLNETA